MFLLLFLVQDQSRVWLFLVSDDNIVTIKIKTIKTTMKTSYGCNELCVYLR